MLAIHRHYDRCARELRRRPRRARVLPARNHAVVLVSKVHLPTLRALAYAQATRPDTLDARHGQRRRRGHPDAPGASGSDSDIPVPLTVVDSPYREITRPIIDYVKPHAAGKRPRDVVTVFIPEYVVGQWWEHLLHNQSALRLKGRLLFEPGVMVTSVPWQLQSVGAGHGVQAQNAPDRGAPGLPEWTRRQVVGSETPECDRSELGPPASRPTAGSCVARHEGRVVFVRYALPGERVMARVTGDRGPIGTPTRSRSSSRRRTGWRRCARSPGWRRRLLRSGFRRSAAARRQGSGGGQSAARLGDSLGRRGRAARRRRRPWAGAPGCSWTSDADGRAGFHRYHSPNWSPTCAAPSYRTACSTASTARAGGR